MTIDYHDGHAIAKYAPTAFQLAAVVDCITCRKARSRLSAGRLARVLGICLNNLGRAGGVMIQKSDFARLLEKVIQGQQITSEEITDLALFVASNDSTEAQRSGLAIAFGIWYLRRFQ